MCGYIGESFDLTPAQINSVLNCSYYGYLSTLGCSSMELIPEYYVVSYEDNQLIFYFISTSNGETVRNASSNKIMTFAISEIVENNCQSIFNSVVAKGIYRRVTGCTEKNYIEQLFRNKYTNKYNALASYNFQKNYYIKMIVNDITGRSFIRS